MNKSDMAEVVGHLIDKVGLLGYALYRCAVDIALSVTFDLLTA